MNITATFEQNITISHEQSLKIAIDAILTEVFKRTEATDGYLFEKGGDIYFAKNEYEELNIPTFAFEGTPERLAALETVDYLRIQLTLMTREKRQHQIAA
jgi:hypothetical protein